MILMLAGCAAPAGPAIASDAAPTPTAAEFSAPFVSPTPSAPPAPTPAPDSPKPMPSPSSSQPAATSTVAPTLAQLIGQKLMVRMTGTTPSASLLARVRAGQIGGVILFGSNVISPAQVASLVAALQAAARKGGRPPLLIATDQEG